jgi:redox-sensitive bicupin YhaK (pirin superfamily)
MSAALTLPRTRAIAYRSRGSNHGAITRLMSPSDLGQILKPFVFLDLFDNGGNAFPSFGLHPHSGLATLTYVAEGSVSYEDTNGATGLLAAGGIEWMRAGKGVWHSGGAGKPGRTRGFQLWVALPPHLELGPSESIYQGEAMIEKAGPARVLLGAYEGAKSAIAAPSPINYLAVTLKAGQRWRYRPPAGHEVLWLAIGKGSLYAPDLLRHGQIAAFEPGEAVVDFAAAEETEFVIGSAVPHAHDLALGYYSVHTSDAALKQGEAEIRNILARLIAQGRRL